MDTIDEFHTGFLADLRQESSEVGASVADVFFERMTGLLEAEGEIVTADRVGFAAAASNKTVRIDGIGGDPREADGILGVIVSDFFSGDEIAKINAQEAKRAFGHLINFVAASRRAAFREELIDGSAEAGAAATISSAWSSITKVKLILMTNAIYSARTDAVLAGTIADIPVTYNVRDLKRFHRYEASGQAAEKLTVNLKEDFGQGTRRLRMIRSVSF